MVLDELNETKEREKQLRQREKKTYWSATDKLKKQLKPAKEVKPSDGSNLPSSFEQLQINMAIGHLKNNPDITDRPVAGFIYDYIEANEPDLLTRVVKKTDN